MNRNTPAHSYDLMPGVSIPRSRMPIHFSTKTSANVGTLFPIMKPVEVLPGDTWEWKTSMVSRLQTLKTPVYDNLYLDTYYFFVPNRLLWSHWINLMGENTESAWVPASTYSTPQVTAPDGGWNVGSLADYFGIPTGVSGISVNALPFRAYAKIVDDWFRDENLQVPPNIPLTDSTIVGNNGTDYVTDMVKGGCCFTACKLGDRFTRCLPAPQKGPDVEIPLTRSGANQLPVYSIGSVNSYYASQPAAPYAYKLNRGYPVFFDNPGHYDTAPTSTDTPLPGFLQAMNDYSVDPKGEKINVGTDQRPFLPATHGSDGKTLFGLNQAKLYQDYELYGLTPVNLVAGNPSTDTSYMATINSLRTAFQIQRLLERDSLFGTRYIEVLRGHFGIINPGDARLQRSEYLGGKRIPLNISQVTQLGATTETSPLGDVAGMSVTADLNHDFFKSFTEHGFIIGVAVARYEHTYQQGLDPVWTRSDRYSYFWPVLSNLGNMPVYVRELYCTGSSDNDDLVFGYQEAWSEYRTFTSMISGELRSQYTASLDIWHFADYYESRPSLGSSWIVEDKSNVDRTLAITSAVSNQFFSDFYFDCKATRPMPLYSVPGLIDHN